MARRVFLSNAVSGPSWKYRRRAVFMSMLFGFAIVGYVAFKWDDLRIAETLALGGFGLISAVVAAYIGGAAYEDTKLYPKHPEEKEYDH